MLQEVRLRWSTIDSSCGCVDVFKFRETGLEWLVDGDDLYTHLHWQRVRRNVVGPLRRSTGIFTQIRIDLFLHHRFGECTERLSHTHDVTTVRILDTIGCECRLRPSDFDFTEPQDIQHFDSSYRITLIGRNHRSEERRVGKECRSRWARSHREE